MAINPYLANMSNSKLNLNPQDFEDMRNEQEAKKAYLEVMKRPADYTAQTGTEALTGLPSDVKSAYKSVGGGWKGVGMGALVGLGNVAKFLHGSTGKKYLAGMAGSPEAGSAWLSAAQRQEEEEKAKEAQALGLKKDWMSRIFEEEKQKQQIEGAKDVERMKLGQNQAQFEREMAIKREELKNKAIENLKKDMLEKSKPIEEQRKSKISLASDMANKKIITPGDAQKVIDNPDKFKIMQEPGALYGTNTKVIEGKLHTDKNGNKAYVFPDGSFQEVK